MKNTLTGLLLMTTCLLSWGQIQYPRISPASSIVQKIGLSEIRIDYSRPGVRGRKIMGEWVPYGRIWRVGANESTKMTLSDSVQINGQWIGPGQYALYAIPSQNEWTIIVHFNTTHWGDGRTLYTPAEDVFRFTIIPTVTNEFTENFEISFQNLTHESADLMLKWEHTLVSFPIVVNTHAQMMNEIEKQIEKNPTAMTYYESARYFQEKVIFPERAKEYLQKAQILGGDKYYIHRVWALVEAQLKNYQEAIRHAELSKKLAEHEGKDEFVRMNDRSITEWKKLVKH
jgi:tetratricopeptide (TPR) repeat protein